MVLSIIYSSDDVAKTEPQVVARFVMVWRQSGRCLEIDCHVVPHINTAMTLGLYLNDCRSSKSLSHLLYFKVLMISRSFLGSN